MVQMAEFMHLFAFDVHDISENQQGHISSSQRLQHLAKVIAQFLAVATILFVLFAIVILFILRNDVTAGSNKLLCLIPAGFVFAILGLFYAIRLIRAMVDVLGERVESTQGPFSISRDDQRRFLVVDGVRFPINRRKEYRLRPHIGQWLTVYYLKGSKRILSIETVK